MMYGHSQCLPLARETDSQVECRSNRELEFTRLNTENTSADGEWHMVTAPRTVLKSEKSVKREGQQDQPEGEFYNSLPRAHFLHPGYFHTAQGPSAFSPYSHDQHFKSKGLEDQTQRDSKGDRCIPLSSRPHPLAQPGFYSPKNPRSNYCESDLSSTKTVQEGVPSINKKEFCSHTLPLPHSKMAVFKQSRLCSKPQGIKTSVVEKPCLMKGVISQILPDSNQMSEQLFNNQYQHIKKQDFQTQYCSSQLQTSVNIPGTEHSRKEEFEWNLHGQIQSKPFQPTQKECSLRGPKCTQDSNETGYMHPLNQPSVGQLNIHLNQQSSCYHKLKLYKGNCIYSTQGRADHVVSSQFHSNVSRPKHYSKDLKGSCKGGNNFSSNMSNQVDMNSRNVFGQPRTLATLRAACSPRPVRKSNIVEDLKKLIVMDDITDTHPPDAQTRTNSSLSEVIQGSASSSPLLSRHTPPRLSHLSLQSSPRILKKDLHFEHEFLPLLNTAHDLDWNGLVNAAEAYEWQRADNLQSSESHNTLLGRSPTPHSPSYSDDVFSPVNLSVTGDTDGVVFTDCPDQLSHLEVVLRRLSRDLLKEKKDKVALLAEVLELRMSNQHLKEESLFANAQLNKIGQIFNTSVYGVDEERKQEDTALKEVYCPSL